MFDPAGLTAELVDELGGVPESRPVVRHVLVATVLRLAGTVTVDDHRSTIRAELATAALAVRLRTEIAELYGRAGTVRATRRGPRGPMRYLIGVQAPGTDLARATGLVDRFGQPVPGLPPVVATSGPAVAAGCWRGALLVRGTFGRPGGRPQLQVGCPDAAVALALVDAARRLGVPVRDQETATEHRVAVRDPDGIETLLNAVGAARVAALLGRRLWPDPAAGTLDPVNAERAAAAATAAVEKARYALHVLGDSAPASLRTAGQLRVRHAGLSLAQLGQIADPPLTKDALATRLRRLSACAEEHAARNPTAVAPPGVDDRA